MPDNGQLIVCCRHFDWRSEPASGDRVPVQRHEVRFQLAGTAMQEAIGAHVAADH